jgi:hypothetical protein
MMTEGWWRKLPAFHFKVSASHACHSASRDNYFFSFLLA